MKRIKYDMGNETDNVIEFFFCCFMSDSQLVAMSRHIQTGFWGRGGGLIIEEFFFKC